MGETAFWAAFYGQAVCDGSDPTGAGIMPNPIADPEAWAAIDPVAGAAKLRGMSVYLATGDGTVCQPSDVQYLAYGIPAAEAAVKRTVDEMDAALRAAHVRHTMDAYGCGLHWWPWWQRDLHVWWPRMMAAMHHR